MKLLVYVFALVFLPTHLLAQTGKLTGRVLDAATQKPLPFANVYVNNSTLGAVTNDNGEFTLAHVPLGATELVCSFLGYITLQVKVVVKAAENKPIAFQLTPDAQQVSEVSVKAGRDKAWEKQLRRFEHVFLGNTSTCKLLNAWAVDFTEANGRLTAKALVPLEIENRALGYKLFFQLKQFVASETEFSIVGNTRFTALEPTSEAEALRWSKSRDEAYRGSVKHLIKSILDRHATQQGFYLYRDKEQGKLRSKYFNYELAHNLAPFDTAGIVVASGPNEFRLAVKERMEVHYIHTGVNPSYYRDVNEPVSWLEVRGGYILASTNGTILNSTDVAVSGNMLDARVSGMLPLDYQPGSLIVLPSPASRLARRLQENVYLHTDKPYYYPGDAIWFSAYMQYRNPGLVDSLSKVLYVDLLDSERHLVQQLVVPLDSGRAANVFRLPATLRPGAYVLRGYTQWMRNYGADQFYYKPLSVLALDERVDGSPLKPVTDRLLTLSVDRPAYKPRERVTLQLQLDTTGLDDGVKGSFSVAVFDETAATPVPALATIKTDYTLADLTQQAPVDLPYTIEKGLTLEGVHKDRKGKPRKASFTLVPERFDHVYPITTRPDGTFSVPNLAFYDSTRFVVQATDGFVEVLPKASPELPDELPKSALKIVRTNTPHVVYTGDTLQGRTLQAVKVAAKKIERTEGSYGTPDVVLKGESIDTYASVADAIAAKVPTFKLIQDQGIWYLIWARASTPTSADLASQSATGALASHEPNLYVNNQLVVGESAGTRLMQLNPALIERIEVTGMINSNQGANGSGGLIYVFTKQPTEKPGKPLVILTARGFNRPVSFSSPDYTRPGTGTTADYRSTLYWNPRVEFNGRQATVDLSFFTADWPGNCRVVVEGVTSRGTPIRSEAVFSVSN